MEGFGKPVFVVCANCHAHQLDVLSRAHSTKEITEFVYRVMVVPISCHRCVDDTLFTRLANFPSVVAGLPGSLKSHVPRIIVMPKSFICQTTVFASMTRAHLYGQTKGQNADLQLIQNIKFLYKEDHTLSLAVRTVGVAAIRDEEINPLIGNSMWSIRGTTWRPFEPKGEDDVPSWSMLGRIGEGMSSLYNILSCTSEDNIDDLYDEATRECDEHGVKHGGGALLFPEITGLLADEDRRQAAMREEVITTVAPCLIPKSPPGLSRPPGVFFEQSCGRDSTSQCGTTPQAQTFAPPVDVVVGDTSSNLPILDADRPGDEAEIDHMIERLQAGENLTSSVTMREVPDEAKDSSELPELDTAAGKRVAVPRFPQVTGTCKFLHGNCAMNLVAAEGMRRRDTGIGQPTMSPQEQRNITSLTEALIDVMFVPDKIAQALSEYTQLSDRFPKKHSNVKRHKMANDVLDCFLDEGTIEAFIKKEVTSKDKPRVVANHGDVRQALMAKVAYVFEKVLFSSVKKASVKEKTKSEAIKAIALRFSAMKGVSSWKENDMTAFEFGITDACKTIENAIIKHIAKHIMQNDEVPSCEFDRHMDERGRKCKWKFTYTDAAGAKQTFILHMPVTMRESGDRITSSGNWLQNLCGWTNYLVDPLSYRIFLSFLIDSQGAPTKYKSARDGRFYWVGLAFEGDDTLAAFEEDLDDADVEAFFKRRGWLPKLKSVRSGVATFVGYHMYVKDAKVVLDRENRVMVLPEIKRCLKDKSWTSSDVPDDVRPFVESINAVVMADAFVDCPPMWFLWNAVFTSRGSLGTKAIEKYGSNTRAILAESFLKVHGDMPTDEQLHSFTNFSSMTPCKDVTDEWRAFAEACAGPCTDEEWCMSAGLTNVDMHGADLAGYFPPSWFS